MPRCLRERAQAVVAGEAAPAPRLQPPGLEVDVVVDDEHALRLDLEEARRRADRAAGLVHVRLGLQQREPQLAEPHLRERAGELRAPGAAVPPRQLVEHQPARVVTGPLVLAARVAEARDQQIQRRGALAPTEEAHLALGRCSCSPEASALPRPRPASLLALRQPPRPRAARPPRAPRPRPLRAPARRTRVGIVTVASTVSSGSSRNLTPSCTGRSTRRSVSPIAIPVTSRSRCSGISIGSASTVISRLTCESTPPSVTPTGSPISSTTTRAWIGWSRRTSCRSTWVIVALDRVCWYSLRIDGCVVFWPSSVTSRIACSPPAARERPAQLALRDRRSACGVLPPAVEDAGDQPLLAQAARLARSRGSRAPGPASFTRSPATAAKCS